MRGAWLISLTIAVLALVGLPSTSPAQIGTEATITSVQTEVGILQGPDSASTPRSTIATPTGAATRDSGAESGDPPTLTGNDNILCLLAWRVLDSRSGWLTTCHVWMSLLLQL